MTVSRWPLNLRFPTCPQAWKKKRDNIIPRKAMVTSTVHDPKRGGVAAYPLPSSTPTPPQSIYSYITSKPRDERGEPRPCNSNQTAGGTVALIRPNMAPPPRNPRGDTSLVGSLIVEANPVARAVGFASTRSEGEGG